MFTLSVITNRWTVYSEYCTYEGKIQVGLVWNNLRQNVCKRTRPTVELNLISFKRLWEEFAKMERRNRRECEAPKK